MKVIFTCGGTAGHVNPALALAGFLRERDPKTRILFVGAERGLERDLIAHTPYPFRTVNISSFHRSLRPKELRHNLVSVRNLMHAKREADAILDEFQPDLIVGTGGYASYPVVRYGHARGIPTAVHESNAVPGLTTRLLENHCDRILVGFEDCRRYYKHKDRVVVTGTPVRGDFFTQTKAQAKEKLGVNDGRPLVVSFWGSLGAGNMNRVTAELLYLEAAKEPFHHVHSVGSLGWQKMHEWVSGHPRGGAASEAFPRCRAGARGCSARALCARGEAPLRRGALRPRGLYRALHQTSDRPARRAAGTLPRGGPASRAHGPRARPL